MLFVRARVLTAMTMLFAVPPAANAQDKDGGRAFAENSMQAYLEMWDRGVSPAQVSRFYGPQVVYYGKHMSRAQVLADKVAFTRSFPVRHYREVPGTFSGTCNADRSRCEVFSIVTWQRFDRRRGVSTGRARVHLTFVPIEGARKIVAESAVLL